MHWQITSRLYLVFLQTLSEEEVKILDGFYNATDTSSARFSELDGKLETATQHMLGEGIYVHNCAR